MTSNQGQLRYGGRYRPLIYLILICSVTAFCDLLSVSITYVRISAHHCVQTVEVSHAVCCKSAALENDSKGKQARRLMESLLGCFSWPNRRNITHQEHAQKTRKQITKTPTDLCPSSFPAPRQWLPVQKNSWYCVIKGKTQPVTRFAWASCYSPLRL